MKRKEIYLFTLIVILFNLPACKKDKKENNSEPPPTPVAAYDFNGNANNSVSQLMKGTKVGGITNSTDSFGTINSAFFFPGNSYVKVTDSDILDFPASQFTISAWIRPVATSTTYIVHKSANSGGGGPYSLDIFPGTVRAIIHTKTDESFSVTGTTAIKKNVWQHVAVSFNGSQLVVYYNGAAEGTTAVDRPLEITTGDLTIGTYEYAISTSFEGTIDNVRIYDKGLSAAQIKYLYQNYNQ